MEKSFKIEVDGVIISPDLRRNRRGLVYELPPTMAGADFTRWQKRNRDRIKELEERAAKLKGGQP